MLSRAAKIYINWFYLGMLVRNALIVATIAIIQAYNRANGQPNWAMIYTIGIIAFAESLVEHLGSAKILNLLLLIWQALQQLNPSSLQQMLVLLQNIQPNAKVEDRPTRQTPAMDPRTLGMPQRPPRED